MSENLKKVWLDLFKNVPETLKKVAKVESAATAFNANIDAVLKLSGARFAELVKQQGLSLSELENNKTNKLNVPADVLKGIFKCFTQGIAEEWLSEEKSVYDWMIENLKYDRLQMGGQGGIVANVLGVTGVHKVMAHTNSLPKLQAEQFLKIDNIVSFDDKGHEKPAHLIDRKDDVPMVHWIIEFDRGDTFVLDGKKFVCPKSNRFIATYDPLNLRLAVDDNFIKAAVSKKTDYVILSGMHALSSDNNGVALVEKVLPFVNAWHNNGALIHLEVASTQDIAVRKAILQKIAPNVDSVGINERELIDILGVIGAENQAACCEKDCHVRNLFEGLLKVKETLKTPRIQLHFFGLYVTLQNKSFRITPEQNRNGMMLAATVAASKAGTGNINAKDNLLWAHGQTVSDIGLRELSDLAEIIGSKTLTETGIGQYAGFDVIVVPTILVEKPVTLVGMGDTISSVSLVGAQ